jgi:hypothetical protein
MKRSTGQTPLVLAWALGLVLAGIVRLVRALWPQPSSSI